jgi:hypothetical protein
VFNFIDTESDLQFEAEGLQPFAATNERFDVQARMRMQREQLAGDLFARWGVLSLGVALADGRRDLHLVGARTWFDGQPALAPP